MFNNTHNGNNGISKTALSIASALASLVAGAVISGFFASAAFATDTQLLRETAVEVRGSAEASIPNDEAWITFSARSEKPTATEATDDVAKAGNRMMAALEAFAAKANLVSGNRISIETTDLSTRPVYTTVKQESSDPFQRKPTQTTKTSRELSGWSANQTIRIRLRDMKAVPGLLEAATSSMSASWTSAVMTYDGIRFSISDETRRVQKKKLIAQAMQDAKEQLNEVAHSLGRDEEKVQVRSVTVGEQYERARPYNGVDGAVMLAKTNAAVAPVVSAGESDVSLTVQVKAAIEN